MSGTLHDDMTPALLDRYLCGECAGEEVARVHAWVAAHPDHVAQLAELRVVREIVAHRPVWNVRSMWENVAGRLGQSGSIDAHRRSGATVRPIPIKPPRQWLGPQPLRQWMWPVATALLMGVVAVIASWNAGMRHAGHRTATSMLTYTTGNGERATITLPDGGTVALNVASRLEVPLDYMTGKHMRTVRLVGEGLFTVPHYAGMPFTVLAGATTTRVLGTSFVVRHYAADTTATIAVRVGRVAVSAPSVPHAVVLAADQQVHVGGVTPLQVEPATSAQFTFATGILTLDGPPLSHAIPELDRWYDADIRLGNPALATQRITGKFAAGSLADLAMILELTFDVRVVRNGRVLTLFPR